MVMLCGMNRAQEYRAGPRDTSFLSILDGGFGLQYSTLLEYREGTGMVLFCQTDVTARSEAIPPPRR